MEWKRDRENESYSRTESSEGHAVRLNRLRDVLINSGSWVWLPTTTQKGFCLFFLSSFAFFLRFLISWHCLSVWLRPLTFTLCQQIHLKVSICMLHSLWRAEHLKWGLGSVQSPTQWKSCGFYNYDIHVLCWWLFFCTVTALLRSSFTSLSTKEPNFKLIN